MTNGKTTTARPAPLDDRLPPQNLEAELGVLAAILLDPSVLHHVLPILKADDFYRDRHQVIFSTYVHMYEHGIGIDAISLTDELKHRDVFDKIGGDETIDTLLAAQRALPHAANARHYAGIVLEKSITRRLVESANEILRDAYLGTYSAEQLLESSERRLFEVATRAPVDHRAPVKRGALKAIERISARREGLRCGVPTGFADLDELVDGLYPGSLNVLAARPSMGKTALGLAIADNVAREGLAVLFVSLEMSEDELGERLLISHSRVSGHKVRTHATNLSDREFDKIGLAYNRVGELNLIIDDASSRTPSQISAIVQQERKLHDIRLVVIDYLQLIDPGAEVNKRDGRQEAVASISRRLKALAKKCQIPVLAIAQLNRETAKRRGHRPRMSDLRESGQIEQDADLVLLLHRPDYYDPAKKPGVAELIVEKNRNGKTGLIDLVFIHDQATFGNISPELPPEMF